MLHVAPFSFGVAFLIRTRMNYKYLNLIPRVQYSTAYEGKITKLTKIFVAKFAKRNVKAKLT